MALGKSIRRWYVTVPASLIAVAVLAVIAFAPSPFGLNLNPYGLNPFAAQASVSLADTERLLPVRIDSLSTEISINGSITFSNKEDLTFGSTGFVDELLVTEGEIVSEGQPLARLDPESTANLQRAIAQAQLDYEDATAALEDAKNQTLQLADAEAAVAGAALELHSAQESLNTLISPDPKDIADAKATIANAELEIHNAEEALETLLILDPKDIADAEEAVVQAAVALQDSEDSLENALDDALMTKSLAEMELLAAAQFVEPGSSINQLNDVQNIYDDKRRDYLNIIYKWTGVNATDEELTMHPDALFASLDFVPELVYDRNYPLFTDDIIADNPETRWNELKVFGWRGLYPSAGQIEIRCDQYIVSPIRSSNTSHTNAELCIQRDMENAWQALLTAENDLISAQASFEDNAAKSQERYKQAEKTYEETKDAVERLKDGGIDNLLLQKQHNTALKNLAKAEQDLEDLLAAGDPVEVENAHAHIALAQANLETQSESLQLLLNPDPAEVAVGRAQIDLAQAKLDQATQDLQKIHDRRALQIALNEASVDEIQAKIDGSIRRYEDSTLKAPWDGYIASIPVEEGQEIEPFEVILTVINSGIVNIEGSVDEIDVLSIQRESPVTVTIDALPDEELTGIITNISSTATNEQGIVTFDVTISVSVPSGVTLQEGLSAVASVSIGEVRGIVIPMQAVQYGEQGAYVRMQDETGAIIEQPVTLGSSDGFYTIVERGLSEGARIVMRVLDPNQEDAGPRFGPPDDDDDDEAGPPPGGGRRPPGGGGGPLRPRQ